MASPIRWKDRLIGAVLLAAAVTTAVLVIASAPASPQAPAQPTPPPAATVDALALDTQNCRKSAQTIEDLSTAIASAGGPRGSGVVAAASRAETRMGRRLTTQNPQLHAVFADLRTRSPPSGRLCAPGTAPTVP